MNEPVMEEAAEHSTRAKKTGPGPMLRAAREARKLSIETVSHQLHLDAAILRALEQDEYEKFAAPIFVTGHLRAYARLLDLQPEPLIDAYHQLGVDAPPPLKQVKRSVHFDTSSSLVPGIIVISVLGIAIALFAGLQNGERSNETPVENGKVVQPEPLTPAVPPQAGDATPPTDTNGGVAAAETDVSAGSATPAPTAPPSVESVPLAAPTGARAMLSLKADQASWVEVRDASGRRLLYDLLDPGASRNVEGVAPFAVILGYGPGVTVEFNGKLIDHSRYMREDIARFRVGEQGADKL